MKKTKTLEVIDSTIESKQGKGFRRHLGASIIGRPCARQLWYTFRWAKPSAHDARLLRLFDRGNLEEERFVKWLRQSGVHVVDKDLATGKQVRVTDHSDHFGGSLDAELFDTPDFPGQKILGEFKTSSDKYFKEMRKKGVEKAKPEHFIQMQVYMHYRGYPAALYMMINKNDDSLYTEIVEYRSEVAEKYIARAGMIINATEPPVRISESPGWYQCKWCDYSDVCHNGLPKAKNCRTCENSRPIEEGRWRCLKYDYILEEYEQRQGCASHKEIHE